jgi:hypothetical protein
MKKNLLLIALMAIIGMANAQYKVLLVDDDLNGSDESFRIDTALAHSGYSYSFINIDTNAAPSYDDLKGYDMVIWTTANDGLNLNLWDTAAQNGGTVKFNDALMQYLDSGKVVWLDGLDFIYDLYGKAPDTFHAGDFVYDVMGISAYTAQSHSDDSLGSYTGCPLAQRSASNNVTTIDTLKWKWSTVWYADAFELTSTAVSLYEMGPAGYDFAGRTMALYNGNLIVSTLRIGSLGDANGNYDQSMINDLVKQMVQAAENGTFAKLPGGIAGNIRKTDIRVYPNPATNQVSFSLPAAKNVEIRIFDITGKMVAQVKPAAGTSVVTVDISNLNAGMYFYNAVIDNKTATGKFSVLK